MLVVLGILSIGAPPFFIGYGRIYLRKPDIFRVFKYVRRQEPNMLCGAGSDNV